MPGQVYLLTTATQGRRPWFRDFELGCCASAALTGSELWIDATCLAWVLMPDHAHFLVELGEFGDLSRVMQRVKRAISMALNHRIPTGSLWQRSFHDHALRRSEGIRDAARYLIANPIRAGLVTKVGDYPFWDAVWVECGSNSLDP